MHTLEQLQGKLKALEKKARAMEEALEDYADRYAKAKVYYRKMTRELEEAEEETFSHFVRSVIGTQEKRVEKERQEQIEARTFLDVAEKEIEEAKARYEELVDEVAKVEKELEAERERLLREDATFEESVSEEKEKRIEWREVLIEVEEAYLAGKSLLKLIREALSQLDSADNWATWDIMGGGWFSDVIKYNRIDDAESSLVAIETAFDRYERELKDIAPQFQPSFQFFSHTHRTIDVFFDNIFTNVSTKNRIQDNINEVVKLRTEVEKIQAGLVKIGEELQENIEHSETLYGTE